MTPQQFTEAVRFAFDRIGAHAKRAVLPSGEAESVGSDSTPRYVVKFKARLLNSPAIRKRRQRGQDASPEIRYAFFDLNHKGLAQCVAEMMAGCPRWRVCDRD